MRVLSRPKGERRRPVVRTVKDSAPRGGGMSGVVARRAARPQGSSSGRQDRQVFALMRLVRQLAPVVPTATPSVQEIQCMSTPRQEVWGGKGSGRH